MKKIYISFALCLAMLAGSCDDYYDTDNDPVIYGDTYFNASLTTDKACYKPGETVHFELKEIPAGQWKVRYSHLGKALSEESLSSGTWSWTPPAEDYKGYLADIYEMADGKEKIHQTIAIDVSSNWKKFPRYGFLSSYGNLPGNQIEKNIEVLNRYHLNGIQFYDWMHDHQRPLAGTVESPLASWPDLMGRINQLSTVKGYIDAAHNRGIKTMFYNLAFGALSNAAADGVKEEWYLFRDANRREKDNHHLDAPFRSSIYLTNPGNAEWQDYLIGRHNDVYKVFNFDGYHIDQLGNRGTVYDYNGDPVELDKTYPSFIAAVKEANPDKRLVMNAVSQYGQAQSIATTDVDFLYTEVWDESKTYEQLARIITDNQTYSGSNTKQTVLAAYMNYARSNNTGFIHLPGVLLTNAVIFSFGGSHLELGEHYLANEYFPNSNLQMKTETRQALMHYYDFLVAYQNLLRDGGTFANTQVESTNGKLSFESWPASQGAVAVVSKKFAEREVIHLINFTNANAMEWRDTNGTQKEPTLAQDVEITINTDKPVSSVWFASPDIDGGVAQRLESVATAGAVRLTLPSLRYWDMIVLEY